MGLVFAWAGFLGSWLLVAGSIYQAALELKDEDIERDRIRLVGSKVKPPPEISVWWWFLPPVKLILERQRNKQYRQLYFKAMSPQDTAALVSLLHKAVAWIYVATGSFCIALKSTYELMNIRHFHIVLYILVVIGLLLASIANTVLNIIRSNNLLNPAGVKSNKP